MLCPHLTVQITRLIIVVWQFTSRRALLLLYINMDRQPLLRKANVRERLRQETFARMELCEQRRRESNFLCQRTGNTQQAFRHLILVCSRPPVVSRLLSAKRPTSDDEFNHRRSQLEDIVYSNTCQHVVCGGVASGCSSVANPSVVV